eukprot:scaffold408_cov388-Prasinococcus_capsulatus_cf.AAC.20
MARTCGAGASAPARLRLVLPEEGSSTSHVSQAFLAAATSPVRRPPCCSGVYSGYVLRARRESPPQPAWDRTVASRPLHRACFLLVLSGKGRARPVRLFHWPRSGVLRSACLPGGRPAARECLKGAPIPSRFVGMRSSGQVYSWQHRAGGSAEPHGGGRRAHE